MISVIFPSSLFIGSLILIEWDSRQRKKKTAKELLQKWHDNHGPYSHKFKK